MTQPRPRLAKRAAALLIDFLAVGIISHLVPVAGFLLVLVVAFLYQWGMIYWRGATLGGMLLKLKVARTDGNPMDASIAGVRAAASFLSIFSLGLGWIWAHWDPDKQSWHDKLAGTVIVELQQAEALI